jgi:hypothetical protein
VSEILPFSPRMCSNTFRSAAFRLCSTRSIAC